MDAATHDDIRGLMERYFEGLYQSDSTILRTVFHGDLVYVNGTVDTYEPVSYTHLTLPTTPYV